MENDFTNNIMVLLLLLLLELFSKDRVASSKTRKRVATEVIVMRPVEEEE
jgi:hypothetical protein